MRIVTFAFGNVAEAPIWPSLRPTILCGDYSSQLVEVVFGKAACRTHSQLCFIIIPVTFKFSNDFALMLEPHTDAAVRKID